jgi:hypothetical protein
MNGTTRKVGALLVALLAFLALAGCDSAASVASENVSTAADNFEVNRLIVGVNLRTGETLFTAQGACSITRDGDLVVICKESANPDTFKKHYFGLAEGVTYVSTQLGPVVANQFRTRIILRPTTILTDFDLSAGL